MNISCPHCSQTLELTPEVHAQLQGQPHFACPTCQGLMAVPPLPSSSPQQPPRRPADVHKAAMHAQRGLNRNLLVLGVIALLALGGLATFLASRHGGSVFNIFQNITNQIIHNNYFTQLIASGVTTEKDLKSIGDIRPYGDGFIGVSKDPLTWEQAQDLAKRTGSEILGVEAGSKQELLAWLAKTFSAHLSTPVWLSENNEVVVLSGSEILASKEMNRQRKVLLHWQPTDMALAAATKDQPFVNALGMKFVPVPGTKVLFCIHETRRQDYAAYAAAVSGVDGTWKNSQWKGFPCGYEDAHPVVGVSWEDAQAFCQWLSKKEGRSYRLATDREWSYAAGLGQVEKWTEGTTPASLSLKAASISSKAGGIPPMTEEEAGNFADTALKAKLSTQRIIEGYTDGFATTAPVMSFKANKLGIYDLGGNVWEFCEDWFNAEQKERVLRGASFDCFEHAHLLSSDRIHCKPGFRWNGYGFRIVLEVSAPTEVATVVTGQRSPEEDKALALITRLGGKYAEDAQSEEKPNPIIKVHLAGKNVDDASLLQLRGLKNLRTLDLNGCDDVGDEGLAALRNMEKLDWLMLWGCHKITDRGFEHLQGLKNLTWLNIGYSGTASITGSGLVHLKSLTSLRFLNLGLLTQLEDRHLESLSSLVNLEELGIGCRNITDAGLEHINRLVKLQRLDISGSQVTDAGLLKLKGMTELRSLRLNKIRVTDAGIADLQKALPGLNIKRD